MPSLAQSAAEKQKPLALPDPATLSNLNNFHHCIRLLFAYRRLGIKTGKIEKCKLLRLLGNRNRIARARFNPWGES